MQFILIFFYLFPFFSFLYSLRHCHYILFNFVLSFSLIEYSIFIFTSSFSLCLRRFVLYVSFSSSIYIRSPHSSRCLSISHSSCFLIFPCYVCLFDVRSVSPLDSFDQTALKLIKAGSYVRASTVLRYGRSPLMIYAERILLGMNF